MTDERQITEQSSDANQISTKRGFPVYRTNPSVPSTKGLPTRSKRFHVPGGKASMIVDNSTGEIKGIGGMGFWWDEEVDSSRFVKLFLDGIKQAAGLSKTGIQVFELVYHQMRANPGSNEIKASADAEAADDFGAFSWLRGVQDRAIMLEIRHKDGRVTAKGYSWLQSAEFDGSNGITLNFSGETVTITGRNLNAEARPNVRLFAGILRHRVPWIQEADGATAIVAAKDTVVIEEVKTK